MKPATEKVICFLQDFILNNFQHSTTSIQVKVKSLKLKVKG